MGRGFGAQMVEEKKGIRWSKSAGLRIGLAHPKQAGSTRLDRIDVGRCDARSQIGKGA
jgi:hypothetical protein